MTEAIKLENLMQVNTLESGDIIEVEVEIPVSQDKDEPYYVSRVCFRSFDGKKELIKIDKSDQLRIINSHNVDVKDIYFGKKKGTIKYEKCEIGFFNSKTSGFEERLKMLKEVGLY